MPKKYKPSAYKQSTLPLSIVLGVFVVFIVGILVAAKSAQQAEFDTRTDAALGSTQYPVPELPSDNLIANPWFHDNTCAPKLAPWVSVPNLPGHAWTASDKLSNPGPAGGCITAGRISIGEDGAAATVPPNADVSMYQIVAANPANKTLVFDMYYVLHTVNYATVTVYGGQTSNPNGSWTEVWTPFSYSKPTSQLKPPAGQGPVWLWKCYSEGYPECNDAPKLPATATLSQGYPFYKIVFASSLPPETGGYKQTGIYLAAKGTGVNPPPVSPTPPAATAPPKPSPMASTKPSPSANTVPPVGTSRQDYRPTPKPTTRPWWKFWVR